MFHGLLGEYLDLAKKIDRLCFVLLRKRERERKNSNNNKIKHLVAIKDW